MNGCGVQWNVYVPGVVNVCAYRLPGSISPESKLPLSATTECCSGALFVQITVVPAATSMRAGANSSCRIVARTVSRRAGAGRGAAVLALGAALGAALVTALGALGVGVTAGVGAGVGIGAGSFVTGIPLDGVGVGVD